MTSEFIQISLIPMAIGTLAAIGCALPGNFLLLRRQALISDSISHVVFLGIVVVFLLLDTLDSLPILLGALAAAFLSIFLTEAIRRFGRIEPGAAMGVVFTTLFALGVLLLETTESGSVHIDTEHVLMGNLESLIWLDGSDWSSLLDSASLATLPDEFFRVFFVCLSVIALTLVFWRPLKISTFDEDYARTIGLPTILIGFGLVAIAAIAAVAAFDAVGSIIVIAMFVCPPSSARLMTNNLERQAIWSIFFASASAIFGYVFAGYLPLWLGWPHALSAAGMIAVVSGLILGFTCCFGPHRARSRGADDEAS